MVFQWGEGTDLKYFILSDASFDPKSGKGVGARLLLPEDSLNKTPPYEIKTQDLDGENIARLEFISAIGALLECRGKLQALEKAELILVTDCKAISNLLDRRAPLEETQFISKQKGHELANADLYREFLKLYDELHLHIFWVKGHSPKEERTQLQQLFSMVDKAARQRLRER